MLSCGSMLPASFAATRTLISRPDLTRPNFTIRPLSCARDGATTTTVEAIFSAEEFVRNLPHSIEAVFYMNPSDDQDFWCGVSISGEKCEDYARTAIGRMREHFGLSVNELPFVRFDPRNWRRPFTDVRDGRNYA